jgi:V-type H+-transporting ATPase proteolipid subunit
VLFLELDRIDRSQPLFAALGAAYGTAKSGIGIAGVGTYRPDLIMKACISTNRPGMRG